MPLTAEERAEINRRNSLRSSGPKTPEGKEKSRRNAQKHGLCATTLALSNEDPDEVEARDQSWNTFFQPKNPAAQFLIQQCVQATLLSDRCDRHHHAVLSKQVREAQENWDRAREDEFEALKVRFAHEPAEAVRLLRRSSIGCLWLVEQWEELGAILQERGHWDASELSRVLGLAGAPPESERDTAPKLDPVLFHGLIADQVATLRAEAERLWTAFEAPDRAEAADRSMMPLDATEARLFLRYHAESRITFDRNFKHLARALELGDFPEPEFDTISRNEPNSWAESLSKSGPIREDAAPAGPSPMVPPPLAPAEASPSREAANGPEAHPAPEPVAAVSRNEAKPAPVSRNEARPAPEFRPVAAISRNEARTLRGPITSVSRNEANEVEPSRANRALRRRRSEPLLAIVGSDAIYSAFGEDFNSAANPELVGEAVLT